MTIGQDLPAQCRLTRLVAPVLSKGNEELLIAREPLLRRTLSAAGCHAVGVICRCKPRHVRNILGQSLLTVDCEIGKRAIRIELLCQRGSRCLEMGVIGRGPPVAHSSVTVELRPVVVETVADLMADDRADGTVVHGGG